MEQSLDRYAKTPKPTYYSVIFTSVRTDFDDRYTAAAEKLKALAESEPGFLDLESSTEIDFEITISYWKNLESIAAWKQNTEHQLAQKQGRDINQPEIHL